MFSCSGVHTPDFMHICYNQYGQSAIAIAVRENNMKPGVLALCIALVPFSLLGNSLGTRVFAESRFVLVRVAEGLHHPWALAFVGGGRILISERRGTLRILEQGILKPVSGVPAIPAIGQGGLMDIALHPGFSHNRLVYFSHAASLGSATVTAVSRARLVHTGTGGTPGWRLEGWTRILTLSNRGTNGLHFGSRLVFDADGFLFVSVGERFVMQAAQDPATHAGKTLRVRADGTVPADNPWVGRAGFLPEIWSLGHRNAQGMAYDHTRGILWQHEHGPRGGDELNIIRRGANYGWPTVTHGIDYSGASISPNSRQAGMESPLLHWTPSIAPSGLAVCRGAAFPFWEGDLFAGALAGQQLRRIRIRDGRVVEEERLLADRIGRIRDVRCSPDGRIWLVTDSARGALYRLDPVR